jgi:hypothetical protein
MTDAWIEDGMESLMREKWRSSDAGEESGTLKEAA